MEGAVKEVYCRKLITLAALTQVENACAAISLDTFNQC